MAVTYACVSKDTERLMNSVSAQISHYSALSQNNPGLEYANVYADCGISVTGTAKRSQLLKMLDGGQAFRKGQGELHGHLLQPDKMRGLRELVRLEGVALQQQVLQDHIAV